MEAKELRLNNYVFGIYIEETENADIEEKCICSVDVIDGVGCTEYNIWASSIEDKGKLIEEWERFEPIPLTEKWLLDFGFEVEKEGEYYLELNDNFSLLFSFYNGEHTSFLQSCFYEESVEIKFVHQLQNLYFALTGEELTLKPEPK